MIKQCLIPVLGIGVAMLLTLESFAATTTAQARATAVQPAKINAEQVQTAKASPQDNKDPTFLQLLQKGGPVMYPLYLCSILLVAFAIERAISLRKHKVSPRDTADPLRKATAAGSGPLDIKSLLELMQSQGNPLSRIATACLCRADRPILEIEKAAEDAAAKEVALLQRNNRILSSVASVAPLLGLLGTVTGIINTFMLVSKDEEALGRTSRLAGGIYEALVATGVGLFIAITALILYFFFQERVDRLVADVETVVTGLLEKLAVREKK